MGEEKDKTPVFNVEEWCAAQGLNSSTQAVLETEQLDCVLALETLSRDDVLSLRLPLGQRNLLIKAVMGLHVSTDSLPKPDLASQADVAHVQAKTVTTKTLARDKELTELAKSMQEASLKDLLSLADIEKESVPEQQASKSGEKTKALLIPDFVSKPKGLLDDDDEDIELAMAGFQSRGQKRLVLKGKNKPRVDEVTLPMWVSANARILQQLVEQESDESQLRRLLKTYLNYTAQVGDLCQLYTTTSVMVLDDVHRHDQATEAKPWNDVTLHSMIYHLEKKQARSKETPSRAKQRAPRAYDADGREICISYNSNAGCTYPQCKYSHVCMVSGCNEKHPLTQHHQRAPAADQVPPRFRRQQ